jgi:hypothetical protein
LLAAVVRAVRASVLVTSLPPANAHAYVLEAGPVQAEETSGNSNLHTPGIAIDDAGRVCIKGLVGPSINDGATHDVMVRITPGVETRLYVDGVDRGVGTALGSVSPTEYIVGRGLVGVVSHVAIYTSATPSAARATEQAEAVLATARPTTEAMERVAAITGAPVGTLDTSLTGAVLPNVSGSSAADVLANLTAAEGGLTYFDGSGNLRFVNRSVRPLKLTPDMTVSTTTSELISPEAEIEGDAADVVNYATVKRSAEGAPDVTLQVAASVAAHGRQPMSETYWVGTDDEARDRAGWVVYNNDEPRPRIASLKLDVMTASAGEVTSLLTLELGSRIRLSNLPSQAPSTTVDLHIDGWTETISVDGWTLDLNVTAWELQEAWLLNNATYSVLGTTTKLGV